MTKMTKSNFNLITGLEIVTR